MDEFTQKVKVPDVRNQLLRQLKALEGSSFKRIEWRVADQRIVEVLKEFVKSQRDLAPYLVEGKLAIVHAP